MNELFTNLLNALGLAWWVEITTDSPHCVYYFGPFSSAKAAREHQSGYVEDLAQEDAQNIVTNVKRCKPKSLTIYDEVADQSKARRISGVLSSQF